MNSEIERLAKEAGITICPNWGTVLADVHRLAKFAALCAEECAKVVEPDAEHRKDARYGYLGGEEGVELLDLAAAAIRAKFALSSLKDAAK